MKKYLLIIPVLSLIVIGFTLPKKLDLFSHVFISNAYAIDSTLLSNSNSNLPLSNTKETPDHIKILVYHSIAPTPNKKESLMTLHYRITPSTFESQMQYLKNNGYNTITLSTLIKSIINKTLLPKNDVVLTFDDGWKNQYTYAYPILKKYNFIGTFFIITSYPTDKYPAYMSWDQILSLDKSGMEIGSHTVHHLNMTKINSLSLQNEVVNSKKTLEDKIGHSIKTFAYPDYAHNTKTETAIKDAGYIGARIGYGRFKNTVDHVNELISQEVVNNPNPFASKRIAD